MFFNRQFIPNSCGAIVLTVEQLIYVQFNYGNPIIGGAITKAISRPLADISSIREWRKNDLFGFSVDGLQEITFGFSLLQDREDFVTVLRKYTELAHKNYGIQYQIK